jgi:hypothetical protein
MEVALQTSASFILIILVGVLLKKKISSNDEINGLKMVILTIALPSTIFIALINVKLEKNLLFLPILTLGFNMFLYFIAPVFLKVLGIDNKGQVAAARLLIPSLAPGLSCFPFILEFLGEDYLARAAMADLGNKFFVLFVLYLVAIKWFYNNHALSAKKSNKKRLKGLAIAMVSEPINLFIGAALVFLITGYTLDKFPVFIQQTLNRLSLIMTPLILLFIGLAVKIKKEQFFQIFSILMLRASTTLFLVGLLVKLLNINSGPGILFYMAFGLSACSFWPFAHISAVTGREKSTGVKSFTFDINFSLGILALSLPLSVVLILGILTAGNALTSPQNIFLLALVLFLFGMLGPLIKRLKKGFLVKEEIKSA